MLFDTHCHLNFRTFDGKTDEIVKNARDSGVGFITIPGTDSKTSAKALEIARKYDNVYAAVGIHPHHIFEMMEKENVNMEKNLSGIKLMLDDPKVVAVGEVGLDRHMYKKTKYPNYQIEERFIELQKKYLAAQIGLAVGSGKSLILHNREAKKDFLELLDKHWDVRLEKRTVFHCCEPDQELLEYAIAHKMFIGVDGDVVYYRQKQDFIKQVPLDMLVLETDSPFLSPFRKFPNEPKNIAYIVEYLCRITGKSTEEISKSTFENSKKLFELE